MSKTQKERHVERDDIDDEPQDVIVGERQPNAHCTDSFVVSATKSEPPWVFGLVRPDVLVDLSQVDLCLRLTDDGALRSGIEACALKFLRGFEQHDALRVFLNVGLRWLSSVAGGRSTDQTPG